jgi:hypothetical protein
MTMIIQRSLVVVLLVGSVACAASSRQRPVGVGDVAQGTDSLVSVRKQFEGSWTLVSLHFTTPDGKQSNVDASGTLSSDAFGELAIQYKMSEQGVKSLASLGVQSPNPVITTSGRAVFNPQLKQVTYTSEDFEKRSGGFDPKLAALRANPFALERIRYYSFESDGTLRLATKYDSGTEAIVSRWKKGS